MTDRWYDTVAPGVPLTQGDLIFDCPLVTWQPGEVSIRAADDDVAVLTAAVAVVRADVVVMTQACDLEHNKVHNVVVCPHWPLSRYQERWEAEQRARSQNPSSRAWRNHCDDLSEGLLWNLAMLDNRDDEEPRLEHRVVGFHEIYTIPRSFLESRLRQQGRPRVRLRPPYREHLSQAFARFFMRVGLPVNVAKVWGTA